MFKNIYYANWYELRSGTRGTVGRWLVLLVAGLGSISNILYGSLKNVKNDPWVQSQELTLSIAKCGSNTLTNK